MKNINKLSFSMLALVAALASTDAMAGSYDPTCDGNVYDMRFQWNGSDAYYDTSGTGSSCTPNPMTLNGYKATYGSSYTFPTEMIESGNVTDVAACWNNPGYTLKGWKYLGHKSGDVWTEDRQNKTYSKGATLDSFNLLSTPYNATLYFDAIWTANSGTLTLTATNADTNSGLKTLHASGTDLYLSDTFTTATKVAACQPGVSSCTGNTVPNLPERTGYTFYGYAKQDGIVDAADNKTECDSINYDTVTLAGYPETCPLIDSNGFVIKQGIWAPVADGDSMGLYAAWNENSYDVTYNDGSVSCAAGGRLCIDDLSKPKSGEVSGMPPQTSYTYKYTQDAKAAAKPTADGFVFAGWEVTVNGVKQDNKISAGASLSKMFPDDKAKVTLTATWTQKQLRINVYNKKDGTKVNTVTYLYNSMLLNSDFTEMDTFVLPADRSGYTFRGYLYNERLGANWADVTSDSAAFVTEWTEPEVANTTSLLIVKPDGTFNGVAKNFFDYLIEQGTTSIDVYGMWATDCVSEGDAKSNVAGCKLYIDNANGAVSYWNMCDTGYNLGDGNDHISEGTNQGEGWEN